MVSIGTTYFNIRDLDVLPTGSSNMAHIMLSSNTEYYFIEGIP